MSISDADRTPELTYAATVYHGVDLDGLPYSACGGDDLVILGRIHPDKGTADAIDIARRAGRRLRIAGIVQERPTSAERWSRTSTATGSNTWIGRTTQRADLLGTALALLHPISFAEPFGLAVVEAMAAGTPVIAYPRGAMPEIIAPGVTGFLVTDPAAAAAAVDLADTLDRLRIRQVAENRFSAARMVEDYLAVYAALIRRDE